jgi:hypothetical protein
VDSVLIEGEIEKQVPGGKLNWFFLALAWLLFWPVVLVNKLLGAVFLKLTNKSVRNAWIALCANALAARKSKLKNNRFLRSLICEF